MGRIKKYFFKIFFFTIIILKFSLYSGNCVAFTALASNIKECAWVSTLIDLASSHDSPVFEGKFFINNNIFQGEVQLIKFTDVSIHGESKKDFHLFLKIFLGKNPWGEYFVYYYPNVVSKNQHCTLHSKNKGPILSNIDLLYDNSNNQFTLSSIMNWPFDGSIHHFIFQSVNNKVKMKKLPKVNLSLRGIYAGMGDYKDYLLELHTLKAPYDYLNLTSNPFLPYDIKGFLGEKFQDNYLLRYSIKKGKYDFIQNKLELLLVNSDKSWPIYCQVKEDLITCNNKMIFKQIAMERKTENVLLVNKNKREMNLSAKRNESYLGFIDMNSSHIKIPISLDYFGEWDILEEHRKENIVANLIWPKNPLAPDIPIFLGRIHSKSDLYIGHQFLCKFDEVSSKSLKGVFYHLQWGKIGNFLTKLGNEAGFPLETTSMDSMLPHGTFTKGTSTLELYLWLDDDIQVQEGSYYFPLKVTGRFTDSKAKISLNLINGQFDILNLEINGELENGQVLWGHMLENSMELIISNIPNKRSKMLPWALERWVKTL